MNPIEKVHGLGQSLWYDNIERRLLENGALAAMIAQGDIRGVTSNPSIFHNAIAKSSDYDAALLPLAKAGASKEEIYETLAVEDIRAACDCLPRYTNPARAGMVMSAWRSARIWHRIPQAQPPMPPVCGAG